MVENGNDTNQTLTYDEVNTICKTVLDEVIGTTNYQHQEAVKWNQGVVESITEQLVGLGHNYKYCVCCIVMQTGSGAGLNVASSCFWDKIADQAFVVRWENKSVIAISTVFAIKV